MTDKDILAFMADQMGTVEIEQDDLSQWSTPDLAAERLRLANELVDLGEVMARAPSPAAREIHSRHAAITVILNKRKNQ
jgi:hypothetical protein